MYVRGLVRAIYRTFPKYRSQVTIKFDLDQVNIESSKVNVWGLLIDELVVNAFKHAFKNANTGTLFIKLKKKGPMAEMVVADNGPGMPENYNQNVSLGLNLIKHYATKLNAKVKISNRNGTCYKFSFPLATDTSKTFF